MTIRIEAINFNHDRLSADNDALTIRKNQVDDVTLPEWRSGMSLPETSPAAYTIDQIRNNTLTIKVEFTRDNSDPPSVEVGAVARGANVLGDVVSRRINFGTSATTFEFFQLAPPPGNPGVGVSDIAWDWSADGGVLQTTRHRIYTLASDPQAPWGQTGSTFPGFQVPWTDVLDHACKEAAGARTVDEAAAKLTQWLFSLGGSKLQYNEGSGDSCFTIPGMQTFKCTDFLQLLAAGPGTRARVNCTDCATILSSFANILGCNLTQSRIGFEFETNLIQKIGLTFPNRQYFTFHEVAWKFPFNGNGNGNGNGNASANVDAFVYDPCLQLDGDGNLADLNFQPKLGINLPLGVPGSEGYHFRLIAPAGSPPQEKPLTRVRRKIDGPTAVTAVRDPEQQKQLAVKYDFPSWQGLVKPCKYDYKPVHPAPAAMTQDQFNSDLPDDSFNQEKFSPSGWQLSDVKHVKVEPDPEHMSDLDPVRLSDAIWTSDGCYAAKLRVVTYECPSSVAARSFVLTLLGEFEVPAIKRRNKFVVDKKEVVIGDVAFADLDELVLLFARNSTVILIQNAGRTIVPVSHFAHELDTDISTKPKAEQPIAHGILDGSHEQSPVFPETECKDLDYPDKEEESVMPDIRGSWSLRRLTSDGSPADLNVDGFIQIDNLDSSGAIKGSYVDLKAQTVVTVTGTATHIAPNSFRIVVRHPIVGGATRQYEGELVAVQEGTPEIQVVVGRFRQYSENNGNPEDTISVLDSQEGGVWVATKP